MANTAKPFGFRPVCMRSGAPWTGETMTVIVTAANTDSFGAGDWVKFAGDQAMSEIDGRYYPVVSKCAASDPKMLGAVVGVMTTDNVNTQYSTYRPAAAQTTTIRLLVPSDKDVIYEGQEDSDGGAIASTAAGQNVDFVVGAVDPYTGMSTSAIDSSTAATTSTLPLRLISYADSLATESGTYAIWRVTINNFAFDDLTGV